MKYNAIAMPLALVAIGALPYNSLFAQTNPPTVTNTRVARGATQAFGRAEIKANRGNVISQRGFCYSSVNAEPTMADSCTSTVYSQNGQIFCMENLKPATFYYARPFALAKNGALTYGEVVKFCTLPMGQVTWEYDNGGSSDQNNRINSAVKECVDYWNNLTSLSGVHLNVHYGSQTPTADCSYGGWMRVGPNASYQRTGTILHEALHAIGVGTCGLWNDASSPLRGGSGTGLWLGDRATELVRFWDNSTVEKVTGDGTHVWATGGSNMTSFSINGAQEDTGTAAQYIAGSLLTQALCEDGLPPTYACPTGLPYYSFAQEDTIKYYIKSEAENRGLTTSFLTETATGALQWNKMTASEAATNDKAAWYLTFTPATQLYRLTNVETGHQIVYTNSAFRAGSANEGNFQLMRSRKDVTSAEGEVLSAQRGYWMICPGANFYCMSANGIGGVSPVSFNIADNQQQQRWLILTSAEAEAMEASGLKAERDGFATRMKHVSALAQVPHVEIVEGTDAAFESQLASLATQLESASSADAVQQLSASLNEAAKTFLKGVRVQSEEQLFDLTYMMTNPDLTNGVTGWSGTVTSVASYDYNEVEFYEQNASMQQVLSAMPVGTYRATCQGFQRPGSLSSTYTAYSSGDDQVNARLVVGAAPLGAVNLKNLMADRSTTSLHSADKVMGDGTYVPNTMASAAAHFAAGYYQNVATYYQSAEGSLKIFVTSTANATASYWLCVSNFKLYSFGNTTQEALAISEVIETKREGFARRYDLQGRQVESQTRGLTISQGRKSILR